MASVEEKPSLREKAIQHLIVFFFGFVFPGLTTMIAPATWISFSRSNEAVQCTTRTCVFFIVPLKVQQASLASVVERCNRFLESPNESQTTIFAIANWKFGAIMGGVLTSLTVLCVAFRRSQTIRLPAVYIRAVSRDRSECP